jgi:hypothetical protein
VAGLVDRKGCRVEIKYHLDPLEPFTNPLGGELAAVVAADVFRHTSAHEQIAQPLQHVLAR